MKKIMTIMGGIVLVSLFAIVGVYALQEKSAGSLSIKGDDEAGFAEMAKISFDSAMNEALKAVPGKVVKAELENENGYLVYGVEIAKADRADSGCKGRCGQREGSQDRNRPERPRRP